MQVIELVLLLMPFVPELFVPSFLAYLIRIVEGTLRKLLSSVTFFHTIN